MAIYNGVKNDSWHQPVWTDVHTLMQHILPVSTRHFGHLPQVSQLKMKALLNNTTCTAHLRFNLEGCYEQLHCLPPRAKTTPWYTYCTHLYLWSEFVRLSFVQHTPKWLALWPVKVAPKLRSFFRSADKILNIHSQTDRNVWHKWIESQQNLLNWNPFPLLLAWDLTNVAVKFYCMQDLKRSL